jgi:CBS domain-containing protein
VVAEGKDPLTTKVREAMTQDLAYCRDDQEVEKAAEMMQECQIRRLPVLDHDERLVGIVSLADLVMQTGDPARIGEIVQEVFVPAGPRH